MTRAMRLFFSIAMLAGVLTAALAPAQAHDGEHAPVCDITPREVDSLVMLFFDEGGTPIAQDLPDTALMDEADLPAGAEADAATIASADATVHMWLSCQLNGDELRAAATMTDAMAYRYLQTMYVGRFDSAEALTAVLANEQAASPVPVVAGGYTSEPRSVRVLDDGRVGGIWDVQGDRFFAILASVDGELKLDEIIDVVDMGTPTT